MFKQLLDDDFKVLEILIIGYRNFESQDCREGKTGKSL